MVEKSLFSLLSMGQMQNGFIKGGSLKRFQELEAGREAIALVEALGTEMMIITETGVTGGEVAVEAGIGMSVAGIVAGNGIIAIGVEAVALV